MSALDNLRSAYRLRGMKGLFQALGDYLRWRRRSLWRSGYESPVPPSKSEWMVAYRHVRPQNPVEGTAFTLIVDGIGGSRSDLKATISSLVAQSHSAWQLVVITKRPRDDHRSDPRVRFRAPSPNFGDAVNAIVREDTDGHVLFLKIGDTLRPDALEWFSSVAMESDLVYCDGGARDNPNSLVFKPGWSPRLMLTLPYLDGPVSISRAAFLKVGGFRQRATGMELADLVLRLAEITSLDVTHIPLILQSYWTRPVLGPGVGDTERALQRRGWQASEVRMDRNHARPWITFTQGPESMGIKVVLPTRDQPAALEKAVDSVLGATGVKLAEIVIVDNGSNDPRTLAYLESITAAHQARVVRVDEPFNFSRLCNIGVRSGDPSPYVLLLNNDVEALDPRWLMQLAGWLINDESVAAIAPQLRYPDGTVQYGGTVVGMGGIAGHYGVGLDPLTPGLHQYAREVAAVTAACLLVRTGDFESVGGFAEDLPTDFQDVDFSLKLREKGRVLMYDPSYPLIHVEGGTRGRQRVDSNTQQVFFQRWKAAIQEGDPYYSPHLSEARWDVARGWLHDPNELRELPATAEESRARARPRRAVN